MVSHRVTAVVACLAVWLASAPPVLADTDSGEPPSEAALTTNHGGIPSAEPVSARTPDGWTLTISSKDETLLPVQPLTTALSSRAYVVGGTFMASLVGSEEPRGVLEVGYQIGCGIDMSTSNGVTLGGTTGLSPSIGVIDLPGEPTLFPSVAAPTNGAITIGLKPGIINIVPVDKKEFKGAEPWVMISNFHVKIDGCVGQSFIRSYVTLTRQTEESDAVLSWLGNTKIL
jgi:hypothetical protein